MTSRRPLLRSLFGASLLLFAGAIANEEALLPVGQATPPATQLAIANGFVSVFTSKSALAAEAKKAKKKDAVILFTGLHHYADGRSRLFIRLSSSAKAELKGKGTERRVVIRDAQIGSKNNRNPLVVTHPDCALLKAVLQSDKKSEKVELLIQLQQEVPVSFEVKERPDGSASLLVDIGALPKKSESKERSDSK